MVSVLQSCQAGLTSLLLGCAETASDCLYGAGHCDLQCYSSTPEIPPPTSQDLPNSLDSKTYNRLVCRHCCRDRCCCGFLAVSYSPVSGPNMSIHMFLPPTLPMLSSLQHLLQQSWEPCRHPSCARVPSQRDLLQQALLGAGLCSRNWL